MIARGTRLIAASLLQGSLAWDRFWTAMKSADEPTPELLLRTLVQDGILPETALAQIESTLPFHDTDTGMDAEEDHVTFPDLILSSLHIPRWRQYRNLQYLGEGGMGRIFKAYDSTLHRFVALKFLRRREPELVARFRQEAQLQGRVEHANVCRVYEVVDWHGQTCIAMQFIHGESLEASHLKLSIREKVRLMADAADAVHAAHRQGLIHRDLKPANIMIEQGEGLAPRAMVLDFGLARAMEGPRLTQDGAVMGTCHYMAPEQARGQHGALDRRTDVYGLGATLYSVLTGHPPFWDSDGMEVGARILDEIPKPLSKVAPDLPEDLETIVATCLEKDPERRYASARELAEDLRRFLDDAPIMARKPSRTYRLGKYARKHRTLVTLFSTALLVATASAALGIATWLSSRAMAHHSQQYTLEAERLEALTRYSMLLPAHDIRKDRADLRARMAALEARITQDGRHASGPGAYALGRGHLAMQEHAEALVHFERAIKAGFDTPGVRQALGRTQAQLYLMSLSRLSALPAELRPSQAENIEVKWKRPALANLKWRDSGGSESGLLAEALVTFQEGRLQPALKGVRSILEKAPWYYEAKLLESQILLAMARGAVRHSDHMNHLEMAIQAVVSAREIAPSDPAAVLAEASVRSELLSAQGQNGSINPSEIQQFHKTIGDLQKLDPDDTRGLVIESGTLLYLAQHQWVTQGISPVEALTRADRNLDAVLTREPDQETALAMRLKIQLDLMRVGLTEVASGIHIVKQNLKPLLDRNPSPDYACQVAAELAMQEMELDMEMGRSPEPAFQEGMKWVSHLIQRLPNHPAPWRLGALLWELRAASQFESEEDARPACIEAIRHWTTFGDKQAQALQGVMGAASPALLAAEVALLQGDDPRHHLMLVEQNGNRVLRENPSSSDAKIHLLAHKVMLARYQLRQGDPVDALLNGLLRDLNMADLPARYSETLQILEGWTLLMRAQRHLGTSNELGRLETRLKTQLRVHRGGKLPRAWRELQKAYLRHNSTRRP